MRWTVSFSCMAIAVAAISSLAAESYIYDYTGEGVTVGDKLWLEPTLYAPPNELLTLCPDGVCSGSLPVPEPPLGPGGSFDLAGYHWASIDEVNELLNSYGVDPEFSGPFQVREEQTAVAGIANDFYFEYDLVPGFFERLVRVPGASEDEAYSTSIVYNTPDGVGTIRNAIDAAADSAKAVWLWRPANSFLVRLEEPIDGMTHSGIGNLRGWAIAEAGIDRVEIYIDGKYAYNAPYGGSRGDVKKAYPNIPDSGNSGFSLAFGYSNLGFGQHTIMARAFNESGEWVDASSTFDVAAFDKKFIEKGDVVDASQAQTTASGDEISIENILIDSRLYDLRLKWRTQEQGFEIVEIR